MSTAPEFPRSQSIYIATAQKLLLGKSFENFLRNSISTFEKNLYEGYGGVTSHSLGHKKCRI